MGVYVASPRWQHLTGLRAVIWSIIFLEAVCSLMQEIAKSNTMEEFLKGLSNCVARVTFLMMHVKIRKIQSHASGYQTMMIRVLEGISSLHGPELLVYLGVSGNLLGSVWIHFVDCLPLVVWQPKRYQMVNLLVLRVCLSVSATICSKLSQCKLALLSVGLGPEDT